MLGIKLAQKWAMSCADLQQPLVLRGLTQKHARDASYTGSAVLSFLERSDSVYTATSIASSPASLRLATSPLASRSQSFAVGQLQVRWVPLD